MSDFQSPETPVEMRPEDPHTDSSPDASTPGLLAYDPVAVYLVSYTGATQWRLGSNGPFLFNIIRADGQIVGLPVIKSGSIVCPDGTVVTADLVSPSAPTDATKPVVASAAQPGTILPVYLLYTLSEVGEYQIRLELAWGEVLASTPQQVTLTCNL